MKKRIPHFGPLKGNKWKKGDRHYTSSDLKYLHTQSGSLSAKKGNLIDK